MKLQDIAKFASKVVVLPFYPDHVLVQDSTGVFTAIRITDFVGANVRTIMEEMQK